MQLALLSFNIKIIRHIPGKKPLTASCIRNEHLPEKKQLGYLYNQTLTFQLDLKEHQGKKNKAKKTENIKIFFLTILTYITYVLKVHDS